MDFREYTEYALQAALSLTAISSVHLIEPSDPGSFIFLATFPLLFAYTAYISSDGFNRASIVSGISLSFLPLGVMFAFFSVALFTTNLMVSLLGGAESVRGFYGSVPLPMLISGVLLGSLIFFSVASSPGSMDSFRNFTAEAASSGVEKVASETGIFSSTKKAQIEIARSVSGASVVSTRRIVLNETRGELERDEIRSLNSAFTSAESRVPGTIVEKMNQSVRKAPEVEDVVETGLRNLLDPGTAVIIVPIIALGIYGLHPLTGVLVAIFGVLIRSVDARLLGEE